MRHKFLVPTVLFVTMIIGYLAPPVSGQPPAPEPVSTSTPPPDHFMHPRKKEPMPKTKGIPLREVMRSIRIAGTEIELPSDTFVESVITSAICDPNRPCPSPPAYELKRGAAELIITHTGAIVKGDIDNFPFLKAFLASLLVEAGTKSVKSSESTQSTQSTLYPYLSQDPYNNPNSDVLYAPIHLVWGYYLQVCVDDPQYPYPSSEAESAFNRWDTILVNRDFYILYSCSSYYEDIRVQLRPDNACGSWFGCTSYDQVGGWDSSRQVYYIRHHLVRIDDPPNPGLSYAPAVGNTPSARESLLLHELGHVWGLDEQYYNPSTCAGTSSIMDTFYTSNSVVYPCYALGVPSSMDETRVNRYLGRETVSGGPYRTSDPHSGSAGYLIYDEICECLRFQFRDDGWAENYHYLHWYYLVNGQWTEWKSERNYNRIGKHKDFPNGGWGVQEISHAPPSGTEYYWHIVCGSGIYYDLNRAWGGEWRCSNYDRRSP